MLIHPLQKKRDWERVRMRARSLLPLAGFPKFLRSKMATLTKLSEKDIPGASLSGRNPSTLKTDELLFWLKCRGDPPKGLKTKAQMVKRWEDCGCVVVVLRWLSN